MLSILHLFFHLIPTTGWEVYVMMNNKELLSLCSSNSDLERDPHTDRISNIHNATSAITQVILRL